MVRQRLGSLLRNGFGLLAMAIAMPGQAYGQWDYVYECPYVSVYQSYGYWNGSCYLEASNYLGYFSATASAGSSIHLDEGAAYSVADPSYQLLELYADASAYGGHWSAALWCESEAIDCDLMSEGIFYYPYVWAYIFY